MKVPQIHKLINYIIHKKFFFQVLNNINFITFTVKFENLELHVSIKLLIRINILANIF